MLQLLTVSVYFRIATFVHLITRHLSCFLSCSLLLFVILPIILRVEDDDFSGGTGIIGLESIRFIHADSPVYTEKTVRKQRAGDVR